MTRMQLNRIAALSFMLLMAVGTAFAGRKGQMRVIFETDMGNDIDDALALDMLYKYHRQGRVNLMAVMLNKEGEYPCQYIDIMNTWYGFPRIPIGVIHNGADTHDVGMKYPEAVARMVDGQGRSIYRRSIKDYSSLPDAEVLYRKLLAKAPDHSVTIVSVGFSTNLARLLDTKADKYSPLSGKELVARKVSRLVTMAGNLEDSNYVEYNILNDIPSARRVFTEWPTPVVTSGFEVGRDIHFQGSCIKNDFGWAKHHPMVDGYWNYRQGMYDNSTWDLTAVLYAVEGETMFGLSPSGLLNVDEKGRMSFTPSPDGNRRYMTIDEHQRQRIKEYFVRLITTPPSKVK